jgi:hypothetical protein
MSISYKVEQAILARLADEDRGLNAQVKLLADSYGIMPEDLYFDFSDDTLSVFVGTDPEDCAEDQVEYPALTLHFGQSANRNYTKGPTGIFSGDVSAQLIFDIPYEGDKLPRVSSGLSHLLEHAMSACFCSHAPGDIWTPGDNIVWAAEMQCQRRGWREGGPKWLYTMVFTMPFEVESR